MILDHYGLSSILTRHFRYTPYTNDLLPAFEFKPHYVGHRPRGDAFTNALTAAIAEQGNRSRNAAEAPTGEEPPTDPPIDAAPGPDPEESATASTDEPMQVSEPAAEPEASVGRPAEIFPGRASGLAGFRRCGRPAEGVRRRRVVQERP
ncbi:hypothetical protein GCM10010347_30000 [Streptomyces cirratus]|uniref:Uncharacterized protein n=1 Tax=Streptomyces cirratus TaxID=68187 RepID=A0ABQ3ESK5_9ACTN|nr:hypothetical protein GCM10010347_30000 [Streptomyces cirratus]